MSKSINFSRYEISATLKIDQTLPTKTFANLDDCNVFERNRITAFEISKNIYDFNCIPIYSLILDSLNSKEYLVITKNLVLVEIVISLEKTPIYKNIYKIIDSHELANTTTKFNITSNKLQLILKSNFTYNLLHDNTFYNLNKFRDDNITNYNIFMESIDYLIENHGNSINGNISISNSTISSFNNYYFDPKFSNFNQLAKLINQNRISSYSTLFGVDEVFASLTENGKDPSVAYGTSSEIITIDLKDEHSFQYVDSSVINFIEKTSYGMGRVQFVESYFSNAFLKKMTQTKIRYKNTVDNQIFDLKALKKNILKLDKTGQTLPIEVFTGDGPDNIYEMEGNLVLNDIQAYRENIVDFASKQPKILKIYFSKATVDIFKLGKKINIGGMEGNSITVAADIAFNFTADNNPIVGKPVDESNHACSGTLYVLNWIA